MLRGGLLRHFFLMVLLLSAAVTPAQAQFGDKLHLDAKLISERSRIVPGDTFNLAIEATPDRGWHYYWRNPGDAGLPPIIDWQETGGLEIADFQWPIPERLEVVPGEIMDYGYSGREILFMTATAPETLEGPIRLQGRLQYLICDEVCIPEETEISLNLQVGDAPVQSLQTQDMIDAAQRLPIPFIGEALFDRTEASMGIYLKSDGLLDARSVDIFPHRNEILHAGRMDVSFEGDEAVIRFERDGFSETFETFEGLLVVKDAAENETGFTFAATPGTVPALEGGSSSRNLPVGLILFFAFLGGLILNLMPCVLPILSIKAYGIVHAASTGDARHLKAHGIWYTAGVVSTFLAIAAAFVGLRAAGELVSVGFQLQYPLVVFATSLLIFLIGLWLLGMFELGTSMQNVGAGLAEKQGSMGAFFTGGLAAFVGAPCIGPFLASSLSIIATEPAPLVLLTFGVMGFGMALPFLALSFVPGLQKLLPKPGGWMETLKQFFAFPMFLTALWLVTVLGKQTGVYGAGAALFMMVLIAFVVWLFKTNGRSLFSMALAALFVIGGLVLALPNLTPVSNQGVAKKYTAALEPAVWSEAAVSELVSEGRPVFVDFTASWCVTCQINKRTTLQNQKVVESFKANNVAFLVADYTTRDDEIGAALRRFNSPGVPMYLYYPAGRSQPEVLSVTLSPSYVLGVLGN